MTERFRTRRGFGFTAALPGPAESEVDSPGMKGRKDAEALDHRHRGGIAELHGRGPDPDVVGGRGDLADQHRRIGTGDRDEVVFGHPIPPIPPLFGVAGEVDGVAQRRSRVAPGADRRKIEDGQWNVHDDLTGV